MQSNRKIRQFDLYLSSFLAMHGITPELVINGRRVVFEFESSDEVLDLMNRYSSNELVPVVDFTTAVRRLKSQMFEKQKENVNDL